MFKEAKQNRIFQDVIEQVQEAILEGKLKAGDRLPAERKLKEMFQTSRGTLREALRVLEQKGLIEIKTGTNGGAIVKTVSSTQVSESLDLLIRSRKVSLNDLAEFREGVEGIVTGLAAERAKKKDIQLLKKILKDAESIVLEDTIDWDGFINNDNDFHMELARIAGNPIYKSILKTVHDNINRYYLQFLAKKKKLVKKNYNDICKIAEAVEMRQVDIASSLARSHVAQFNSFMVESRKGK